MAYHELNRSFTGKETIKRRGLKGIMDISSDAKFLLYKAAGYDIIDTYLINLETGKKILNTLSDGCINAKSKRGGCGSMVFYSWENNGKDLIYGLYNRYYQGKGLYLLSDIGRSNKLTKILDNYILAGYKDEDYIYVISETEDFKVSLNILNNYTYRMIYSENLKSAAFLDN